MEGKLVTWLMMLVYWTGVCVYLTHAEVTVDVDISSSHALHNENITVVCTLRGDVDDPVIIWFKEIRKDNGDTVKEPIATNTNPTPLYKLFERFHFDKIPEGDDIKYTLGIAGVTSVDSGHYGCYLSSQADAYASQRLDVYNQPYNVTFTNHSISDEGRLVMNELEPGPVECNVLGVMPSPDMKIWVGDKEYTDQFTRYTETEVLCEGSFGVKENCPLHFHYNVHLRHPNFFPSELARDQRIRCQATVPSSGFDNLMVTLPVEYEVSPKFDCEHTQFADIGDMDFSIKCKVLYNPEVWWWTWTFRVDGKEYELRSDEDPGYTHSDIVPRSKVLDEKSMEVSLHIKEVSSAYFTHYKLEVYHPLGNRTLELELKEVPETPPPSSGNVMMSSVLVLLFAAILCVSEWF